jgi:hypothetical protein
MRTGIKPEEQSQILIVAKFEYMRFTAQKTGVAPTI